MDYLVKIRSVQTPLNGQFSIGANTGKSAKEKTASLPKFGQAGRTAKTSSKNGLF